MIKQRSTYKIFLFILILFFHLPNLAQSKKQQELEAKRKKIQQEIQQFNVLLSQGKREQKSVITKVEDINYKVAILQNLINVTNSQANLLTREINNNIKNISNLRDRLQVLKDDYAQMIVKSYKSKSSHSKVMFLLSSVNFKQAYKRLQYIKQYANYQKDQGELIRTETLKLQELNKDLLKQKERKQNLIEDNRTVKNQLNRELTEQEELVASISKDLNKYNTQIQSKRREAEKLDREIERIIKAAIASSNKNAGNSRNANTFALTPREKVLASNFTSNKGRLPWPLERGFVKVKYGRQPSPIDRSVPINSNGVRIVTNRGAKAKAVFEGEVYVILAPKNGNITILLKHGNYFTIYKNLSKVYVKKGDTVNTKQDLGEVLTDKASGETSLSFSIWKGNKTQNPAHWINGM